ncbi:MAG TPA: TldD/PmbA family protein [Firmicutes bacterium]|uniref:TldD/PmbA family protein n=1 Tax=Capillibacterium thermochitinicola TaxID=2699427 RepID=A0A8J6LMG5_9FIRM|nr:metallopeptidase TldD-related protein [Capillibacterium thermochitinicola]MBA2133729.1 TldD/PmbA family protein [Capillibacterium thermochitinicola]HHW11893.1 TldD/PmbA family protein [Bacillota bacterium]
MSTKELTTYALHALKQAGAEKAETILTRTEKTEMNLENGALKLIRTTVDHHLRLTALKNQRRGSLLLNKIDRTALDPAVQEVLAIAASSAPDPAHDIAEYQPPKIFNKGGTAPDFDLMYQRFKTFTSDVAAEFPRILLLNAHLDFTRQTTFFQNSNGVDFTVNQGGYRFAVTFSAREGHGSSSFNNTGFFTLDLKEELLNCGSLRILFDQANRGQTPRKAPGKFTGEVIITPDCLEEFLHSLLEITISDGPLIAGTSPFRHQLNQQVVSSRLTLDCRPVSPEISSGYFITSDGYEAQNATIFENGVLKSFLLSQYGAKKTGLPRAANDGGAFVVTPGDQPLATILKKVKKGLLLNRFSGGAPSPNGDFSGVAKNSFYIEDGTIQYPLSETMIAGNLITLFQSILAVSQERIDFGSAILPWIHAYGVTISG